MSADPDLGQITREHRDHDGRLGDIRARCPEDRLGLCGPQGNGPAHGPGGPVPARCCQLRDLGGVGPEGELHQDKQKQHQDRDDKTASTVDDPRSAPARRGSRRQLVEIDRVRLGRHLGHDDRSYGDGQRSEDGGDDDLFDHRPGLVQPAGDPEL